MCDDDRVDADKEREVRRPGGVGVPRELCLANPECLVGVVLEVLAGPWGPSKIIWLDGMTWTLSGRLRRIGGGRGGRGGLGWCIEWLLNDRLVGDSEDWLLKPLVVNGADVGPYIVSNDSE